MRAYKGEGFPSFSRTTLWVVLALMLSDIIFMVLSLLLAFSLRNILSFWVGYSVLWQDIGLLIQLIILLMITLFMIYGLYPGYGLSGVKELEKSAKVLLNLFFILASLLYLAKPFQRFPRSIVVFTFGFAWWLIPVGRFILRRWLVRMPGYGVPAVVYGDDPEWLRRVVDVLRRNPRMGWRVYAVHALQNLQEDEMKNPAEIAILALTPAQDPAPFVRWLAKYYKQIVLLHDYNYFGSLWVETRDLSGKLGLEFQYHLLHPFWYRLKRALDWIVALMLVILLAPLFLVIMLIIKLDSPGPVFFRQRRLGKDFRIFKVFKFRTMVVNAEEELSRLLQQNPTLRSQYEKYHKIPNDPRVTRVGRWLRKYSLDELPQLINVLRGEMSLVGPRAYMPAELSDMGSYAEIILRVPPGMTGWWQVQGRHRTSFQQRLKMDEYYISNWSIWMDIFILLKTIWVVLSGHGE